MRKNKQRCVLDAIQQCGGGKVLHLGCTDAPFTAQKLKQGRLLHRKMCEWVAKHASNTTVVGVDIDPDGLRILREAMPESDIRKVDAHTLKPLLDDNPEGFDLIIAGDIIEHLDNPGCFLDSCGEVLSENGVLYISTVNALSIVRFAKSLFRYEVVHPDHTAYYSHKTLERLLHMKGYRVTEKGYYRLGYFFSGLNLTVCSWFEEIMCLISPLWAEGIQVKAVKMSKSDS